MRFRSVTATSPLCWRAAASLISVCRCSRLPSVGISTSKPIRPRARQCWCRAGCAVYSLQPPCRRFRRWLVIAATAFCSSPRPLSSFLPRSRTFFVFGLAHLFLPFPERQRSRLPGAGAIGHAPELRHPACCARPSPGTPALTKSPALVDPPPPACSCITAAGTKTVYIAQFVCLVVSLIGFTVLKIGGTRSTGVERKYFSKALDSYGRTNSSSPPSRSICLPCCLAALPPSSPSSPPISSM